MNLNNPLQENFSKERTVFSWIHLSDIHLFHGDQDVQLDQHLILSALINEITTNNNNPKLSIPRPDAVFVTGDIAFSGATIRKDEYSVADQWLINIAQAAGLNRSDVYVIPGNHDVQRNIYTNNDDVCLLIDALREGKRILAWALSKNNYLNLLTSRFENYLTFAANFAPFCTKDNQNNRRLFWNWKINTSSNFSIQLEGLNTSLLSQNNEDKNKLRLSLEQIKDIPNLDPQQSNLTIVMGHHPLVWLNDGDEVEKWIRKKAHIYLSGHIHEPESLYIRTGGGTELVCIQAGAVHGDQEPSSTNNCFNYAAIVINEDGQTILRVWNRIWSDKHKDYRDDVEFHPPDQSYAEFILRINPTPNYKGRPFSKSQNDSQSFVKRNFFSNRNFSITDSPPVIEFWVGREEELSAFDIVNSGVIVVSGIGGQGKSAVASKYLDKWMNQNPNFFWDWRDCREQRERFHNQIVALIEHLSDGQVLGSSLEGAETKEIVKLFFDLAGHKNGLIILDNLDHYTIVNEGKFSLGVADFVEGALKYDHNLVIIITCRPRIQYADPRFHEIHLEGISISDALSLFKMRKVTFNSIQYDEAITKIHNLTDGHPLWLNLIATQLAMHPDRYEQIIDELESGQVDDRAKTMIKTIWKRLNSREQMLLRYMAELTSSEQLDAIFDCVSKREELKAWIKFQQTFRSLQALSLVVETKGKFNQKEYGLHPLIQNYVRSEFPSRKEREPYLDGVFSAINNIILTFPEKISSNSPISFLEYYIKKAEIALKKEDFKTAIESLIEVGEFLIERGMPGEFFRVGEELLDSCEGKHQKYIDSPIFIVLNNLMAETYAEFGRDIEAHNHLIRYGRLIPKGTAQYIAFCNTACYTEWMLGNFREAILWGEEGVNLKKNAGIDTEYDGSEYLALAYRDSGYVEKALQYFLMSYSINEILENKENGLANSPTNLGNIGRCLQMQNKFEQALLFFIKSALILEKSYDINSTLNRGYAAFWIGEIYEKQRNFDKAYIAYRQSYNIWSKRAPLRARKPNELVAIVVGLINDKSLQGLTETGVEKLYRLNLT
jgi:tetratricopeptide (TPR) repeat protein